MNDDLEGILDDLNADYGGDLIDYLGANWRDVLRPRLQDAWNFGYTTGQADCAKLGGDR